MIFNFFYALMLIGGRVYGHQEGHGNWCFDRIYTPKGAVEISRFWCPIFPDI